MHQQNYIKGMREGIPVGLGYFVVSFTIGIAARKANLTPVQATVMSFTNNTSAGQFASFALIASGAPYLEMVISQILPDVLCAVTEAGWKTSFLPSAVCGFRRNR